ncbi:MAG: hypothetical protein ACR2HX_18720 [Pyrinomonadaceae bacterium]
MKHLTKIARYSLAILVLAAAFAFSGAVTTASAQDKSEVPASRANRGGRDPFSKYVPPRVVPKKSNLVLPPSIQERIQQYKAQKQAAMSARVAAPKPTTAFLLSEVQVIGISRSPRGYAAIVEASPIKLAYVIYPGERFYDGQLVAIEDNRLVFRRETVFTDGRRERSVELKALRQLDTIDALAATKTAPASSTAGESDKKSEPKPATEKP